MRLRNGKKTVLPTEVPIQTATIQTAIMEPAIMEPVIAEQDHVQDFIEDLQCIFHEASKYDESSYMKICVLVDLYEFVDETIDEFKNVPRLAYVFAAIRDSCLRILHDVGRMTLKHGKDPEYIRPLTRLSCALLSVMAKLGKE